jgi:Rrf2 family protein
LLSLTGEYALRAVVYLARHIDDGPIPGRQIAADLEVPRKYLSSILGDLVRTGLLEASPGRTGGFRLVRPPRSVRLLDVVAPFEQVKTARRPCPFGNATCSDVDPCAGHDRWSSVKKEYGRFLEETTVFDVAQPGRKSRTAKRGTARKKKKK